MAVIADDCIVATVRDHVSLSVDGQVLEIIGAGVPSLSEIGSETDGAEASQFVAGFPANRESIGQPVR